jgi:hypothetical protein
MRILQAIASAIITDEHQGRATAAAVDIRRLTTTAGRLEWGQIGTAAPTLRQSHGTDVPAEVRSATLESRQLAF